MIREPSRRISACSKPTALLAASSERNELEHTSSARPSVRWASVIRPGRISCRMTGAPDLATCQAASEPARPAPTIFTVSEVVLVPVMGTEVARFRAQWNAAPAGSQIRQRPRRGGRYPVVNLKKDRPCRGPPQPPECPIGPGRYGPVSQPQAGTGSRPFPCCPGTHLFVQLATSHRG